MKRVLFSDYHSFDEGEFDKKRYIVFRFILFAIPIFIDIIISGISFNQDYILYYIIGFISQACHLIFCLIFVLVLSFNFDYDESDDVFLAGCFAGLISIISIILMAAAETTRLIFFIKLLVKLIFSQKFLIIFILYL